MDTFDCIRKKLEVREYLDKPVPREVIEKVVDAGRLAPSSRNRQPWHFVVVSEKESLKRLAELCPSGPYHDKAAFAVVVATDPAQGWHRIDATRAITCMQLAAWNEGIGSCWVGEIKKEEVKAFIGIPKELDILTVMPFGYHPLKRARGKKDRRPLSDVLHWHRF